MCLRSPNLSTTSQMSCHFSPYYHKQALIHFHGDQHVILNSLLGSFSCSSHSVNPGDARIILAHLVTGKHLVAKW